MTNMPSSDFTSRKLQYEQASCSNASVIGFAYSTNNNLTKP